MGKGNSSGKMVDSMKAAGSMANSQAQASTPMSLEKGEKEYGQMESGINGSMDSNTMAQRLESILFQMDQLTRVNYWAVNSTVLAKKHGVMVRNMLASGCTIRCMGKDISFGLKVMNILENSKMMSNMEKVSTFGRTVPSTKAAG